MAKIVSFGDSFILGNELSREDGTAAWPGLLAQRLGVGFETCAVAGCGNEHIARQVYQYFSIHSSRDTLAVINWTWCMRWDVYLATQDVWITLGPTCVPSKLEATVGLNQAEQMIEFYHSYAGSSDEWNRWRTLQTIMAVQTWLRDKSIQSIQTYIDPSMLDCYSGDRLTHYQAFRDPSWPDISHEDQLATLPEAVQQEVTQDYERTAMPVYIQTLQREIAGNLETFEGLGFLDWCRAKHFAITELLHPLDPAHQAAADYWHRDYAERIKHLA